MSHNGSFLSALTQSGLLTAEQVTDALGSASIERPGEELARMLVAQGLLTQFQVWQLQQGKWRGLVIGHFQILGPISRVGMGRVFLALDTNEKRRVAIKLVRPGQDDDEGAFTRLRLEAFACMTLQHPNLLRGIECDRIGNAKRETHYLAMEFVPGPNLGEWRAMQDSLPWEHACSFVWQAAQGLHVAHEAGFVHRDVKPSNLLVSSKGIVKVFDFGLAQYDGPDTSYHTPVGKRLGTPDYVAPEQTTATQPVDRRADIYGLGCTLYFLLSGCTPFPEPDVKQKLRGHRGKEPQPLRQLAPQVPAEVEEIVQRMMAKDISRRYGSMLEVTDALREYHEPRPIEFDYQALLRARARAWQNSATTNRDEQASSNGQKRSSLAQLDPLDLLRQRVDSLAAQLGHSYEREREAQRVAESEGERSAKLRHELDALLAQRAADEAELDAFATQVRQLRSDKAKGQEELEAAAEESHALRQQLESETELRQRAESLAEAAQRKLDQYRERVSSLLSEIERRAQTLDDPNDTDILLGDSDGPPATIPPDEEPLLELARDQSLLKRAMRIRK